MACLANDLKEAMVIAQEHRTGPHFQNEREHLKNRLPMIHRAKITVVESFATSEKIIKLLIAA